MKGKRVKLRTNIPTTILKASKKDDIKIKSFCKIGLCGKCTIKHIEGNLSEPSKKEINKLGEKRIKEGYRLACQAKFDDVVVIEV